MVTITNAFGAGRSPNKKKYSPIRPCRIIFITTCMLFSYLRSITQETTSKVAVLPNWDDRNTHLYSNRQVAVVPNWDDRGTKLYSDRHNALPNIGYRNITFWHFRKYGQFWVSNDECHNRNFWEIATRGGWEFSTFRIFEKYTVPNETIVVDFGTWIGPTLLFHGSFSRRSFGIEADPVAYAVAEYNVEMNRNKSWGGRVSVDPGCIARPEDVGMTQMKAGGQPGKSMSGIGKHVAQDRGSQSVTWWVQCYTLSDIFDNYWLIEKPYKDVLIKIDIESYECKLIPSFYDWLRNETYLPKMFISFHPQIAGCTDEEYQGVLKFFKLYDHIRFGDKEEFDVQNTTAKDFKAKISTRNDIDNSVVAYQQHHAEKFPGAKQG